MKYLKKFEEEEIIVQKYNEGDYVVPYDNRFMGRLHDYIKDKVGKIEMVRVDDLIDMTCIYYMTIYLPEDFKEYYNEYMYFYDQELRPATSQEIEEYILNNDVNKFNL